MLDTVGCKVMGKVVRGGELPVMDHPRSLRSLVGNGPSSSYPIILVDSSVNWLLSNDANSYLVMLGIINNVDRVLE